MSNHHENKLEPYLLFIYNCIRINQKNMSRNHKQITPHIHIYYGVDNALGIFADVVDLRYAESGKDAQGEGYVFEQSSEFGTSLNRIEIDPMLNLLAPQNKDTLIEHCDKFIQNL